MRNILKKCTLCPRNCQINRYISKGFCNLSNHIRISLARPFFYEEPCISGKHGSGAIFFSGCNLKCCFCQNYDISTNNYGKDISITRLSEIMLELQEKGVHNINLVTPTMHVYGIIKAIKKAKENGLNIPIIYNTNGYENVDTIKALDGLIDVYLPDFKYMNDEIAIQYSKAPNYAMNVKKVIDEMVRQTGNCKFDKHHLITRGVIVRHLILPTKENDSKEIIKYLYETYHNKIYLSIMNQYTPNKHVTFKELENPIKKSTYEDIIDYMVDMGINNAYCQEDETCKESFIPAFNLEGVNKKKSSN